MTDSSRNDPHREPDPSGGWSARVRKISQALVVPPEAPQLVQAAGVFDREGAYVHEAVLWRTRRLMVEPERPVPQDHIAGQWVWGGVLLNHFGHFLTESTGRLWGVQDSHDGILFVSKRGEPDEAGEVGLQAYHRLFFDLLGIDLPIRVITQPTTVEVLDVPGQGFGIGAISAGTAEFRAFVAGRFGRRIPAEGSERLYVSRSGLGAAKGGVLEENRIEDFLAEQGYDIFHPQKHSLQVQIARYKAASRIVALDGSALHLVAMLGQPDQKVAVIRRRNSGASGSILNHLASFMGRQPDVIDVIKRDWIRSDRRRADRFSIGELDFEALARKLEELGYVGKNASMLPLNETDAQQAIAAVEARLRGGKLRFLPGAQAGGPRRVRAAKAATSEGEGTDQRPVSARRAARRARRAAANSL